MEELKDVVQASQDQYLLKPMHEELDQIEKNRTWELIPRPTNKNVIGTKWVFKNNLNDCREFIRNNARLVCKVYAQIEALYFDETCALVTRLEILRMFLAFSCFKKFKIYQMDVKSSFLNGELQEEVYIEQPKGFQLIEEPDYVFRLKKALYGLKKAPRAWYSKLNNYLSSVDSKEVHITSSYMSKKRMEKLSWWSYMLITLSLPVIQIC